VALLTIYWINIGDLIGPDAYFLILNLVLAAFLVSEIISLAKEHSGAWMFSPVFVSSTYLFGMGFFLPGLFATVLPDAELQAVGLPTHSDYWINKHLLLAMLGACAMWAGFRSPIAPNFARALRTLRRRPFFRKGFQVQPWTVVALLCISVIARVIAIQHGIFGYTADAAAVEATAAYREYLGTMGDLGKLALLGLALSMAAASGASPFLAFAFAISLVIELGFGFLSGFKSAIVLPLLIVAAAYYVVRGRVYWWMLAGPIIAIAIAYAIVEPFRLAFNEGAVATTRSAESLSGLLVQVTTEPTLGDNQSLMGRIVSRGSLSTMGAAAIQFADTSPSLPAGSPGFLSDILMSPLLAFVPRFAWPDKPMQTLGVWFNDVVLGNSFINSVGMGPIAYLYFAGGLLGVVIGFFAIGLIQRGIQSTLLESGESGAILAYLAVLPVLSGLDSYVPGILIWMMRYFIPIIIAQRLVFRK
jgi:hypothetical protein